MSRISIADLAAVVYSSGKVFDGLATGRLDTENFLRSGDTSGVGSRRDLELLGDLKAVSAFIVDFTEQEGGTIDAAFLKQLNAQMTRSASIEPGELRRSDQQIGVNTVHGRHEPPAVNEAALQRLVERALDTDNPQEAASALFLVVAKAQPFMDGNKRTGIFAGNAYLLQQGTGTLLTVPVDENDPSVAARFNSLLARSYVFNEDGPVTQMLLQEGISNIPQHRHQSTRSELEKIRLLKAKIAERAALVDAEAGADTGGRHQP